MSTFSPVIKWSGSKRSQAQTICSLAPTSFERYYEPFVGGGSILYSLAPASAVAGDICSPLIELWKCIKDHPEDLARRYDRDWHRLQNEGYEVFYEIRDLFNSTKDPSALLFLSRTCVNGLIRFNKNGDFNNSLHHTRPGINPKRLEKILLDWSSHIQGTTFQSADYRETTADASANDFVYLDPPYFNTRGRYFGGIDFDAFCEYLESLNSRRIRFALSFDGRRGNKEYSSPIPSDLYVRKQMIRSGNSAFKKVQDHTTEEVIESLYLNY